MSHPDANDPVAPIHFARRDILKALAAIGAAGATFSLSSLPSFATSQDRIYQLAMQAYVYGYPMVYFARYRYRLMMQAAPVTGQRYRWGEWTHKNAIVTPAVPGAPQTDTLYSVLWLDLRKEPYVLTVPAMDKRYWSLQLCDLLGVTCGLPTHRSLPAGGRIAVVGPDWDGKLPDNLDLVVRSPMAETFNVLRMFFADDADRLKVIGYQQGFHVAPLSAYLTGQTSVPGIAAELSELPQPEQDPLADLKTLQAMWLECPPPARDEALTATFAALALGTGAQGFEHLPADVQEALHRAEKDARQQVIAGTRALAGTHSANGWTIPRPRIGYYDDNDYLYRASITLLGTIALPASENPYYLLQKDGSGMALSGDARYELHFTRDEIPQAQAFWSLHAYTNRYTVIDNPLNRYAISDRSTGLQYTEDGGLVVYLQADDPGADKRGNWLPVKRGEPFWLIVRAYEPLGTIKDLSWQGPRLRKLA
ncbi:DUF1214 domain-containing protein [Pseudomonas sp. ZM23]|uniref:DUF1214 domain-containing protein n=1 Tax=Pseudomonas triclosanedens TaxID=2961893 RepID=A0ABY6ZS70_9PSED|nr:DUF1214 domain-containing protein [Pseudomonas triclosanedens]MCP8467095.1 DUF1214 domain-containing protein [Pseudomonas triclosanedens]MCP8472756.1 DUF1214 domain-containing protein [Pseudomonas triclosanedens]MCP8478187.1 DUF1214 domain-containing protein [Pseudomonas triclosanedens]WAI47593.1 DUF1214 domain-containing protein [Pseudomonas triclosanedens]